MEAKERADVIRRRLNELRKPSMQALIDLHGGAGRGSLRKAVTDITEAVRIKPNRFSMVRNGQISLTEPEIARIQTHLAEYRMRWANDEFMLQLIDMVDATTFGEPSEELVEIWLDAEITGIGPKSDEAEVVATAPTSFSEAARNVPREPFVVLLTTSGTSFVTIPTGSTGEVTFNRAALVDEIHIKAQ